jgi:hypothetical protein
MAKKQLDIIVGVDSSQIDNAVAKTGELKKLSDNISIQYDIDGKPLDVVINKSLNLQKQVRVLTAELRKTKEGTAEFKLLSTALGDANDQLAKSNAKSKDLFGSLSLLPGPIGQFASQIGGAIDLLKVFSSFSLKDLQFQLKETGNDIVDIAKGFLGITTVTKETTNITKDLSNTTQDLSDNLIDVSSNAAATSGAISNTAKQTQLLTIETDALGNKTIQAVKPIKDMTAAEVQLFQAQRNGVIHTGELAVATQGLTAAEKTATFWTSTLGNTIKGVLIGTGIGIAIVVIGELIRLIYDWVSSTEDADNANKALTETIKEQQRVLENDQQAIELSIRLNVARAKAAGKTEQEIFEITKQGGKDKLALLREFDKQLYEDQKKITNDRKLTEEDRAKLSEEINAKILKNGQDITKQIIENGIMEYDNQALLLGKRKELVKKFGEDEYNRRLKELDALIQLEIDKDATDKKVLQGYLDEKRRIQTKHDKLTFAEAELMRQQNAKKVKDALEEDTKRVEAYNSKIADIEIAAIEDEQRRQEEARLKKLNDDKTALQYDYEFQKRTKEEQMKVFKDMETQYAMDILKIKDSFYIKQFQLIQEAALREKELATSVKEQELDNNRIRLEQQNDFNTVYGDFIFGNKGLKAQWEKYFVDLREIYNNEYVATEEQLVKEKEQLQVDLDGKKITRESYAAQIKIIEDKLIQNRQQNTQRQLELDRLELDSKRANADMTIQVGERLASALSAIAGKNKQIQKAAALVEATIAIARIITDTSRAIVAFSASVAPLGPAGIPIAAAYAVKAKISAGLGIATIIAQGIGKLKSIDESDSGGTSGTASSQQSNGLGRGYARGGYIDGPRHAQGGTMIEAEGGEAVMTRGAVTMFAPLLSTLNQMGGGTSFAPNLMVTRPDSPIVSNPAQEQSPMIMKTYVVSKDMTNEQEKQARLKNLSTL